MSKRTLKVGDKVRIKKFNTRPLGWSSYGWMDNYMGKVVTVERVTGEYFYADSWCFKNDECDPIDETIVIYRRDNKVYALNKATNEKAVATCAPEDTFDFNVGAKLAFDRLMGVETKTEEEPKKEPKFKKGDVVVLTKAINDIPIGARAVVVEKIYNLYLLDFGIQYKFTHNGMGATTKNLPNKTGYWIYDSDFEKVN